MIAEKTSGSEAGVVTIATAGGLAGMIYGLVAHPVSALRACPTATLMEELFQAHYALSTGTSSAARR